MAAHNPRAVVLTALPVEYLAVRAHLERLRPVKHPSGTEYETGFLGSGGAAWEVPLVLVGVGNVPAAIETERAIGHFRPDVVLFVGVAGTIQEEEVGIGDVVVAEQVHAYEVGKIEPAFKSKGLCPRPAYELLTRAKVAVREGNWVNVSSHFQRILIASLLAKSPRS